MDNLGESGDLFDVANNASTLYERCTFFDATNSIFVY